MDTTPGISLHLPITLTYPALEAAARKKMLGEALPPASSRGEEPYARLVDLRMAPSSSPGWELIVKLKLDILRTFFKREGVDLLVLVALGYDNGRQLLYVRDYKVDARTGSRIYNTSLEVLANKAGYDKILKKTRFAIGDIIARELHKINDKLAAGMALKGLVVSGSLELLRVEDMEARPEGLQLNLRLQGQLQAQVLDLLSLMPENNLPL
jgi:hypothetical protein